MYEEHPEWRKTQEHIASIEALYAEHEAIERLLRKDMISSQLAEEEIERIIDHIEQKKNKYYEEEN
jgi:monovalent cation:H+ antiporter, CPA1 family